MSLSYEVDGEIITEEVNDSKTLLQILRPAQEDDEKMVVRITRQQCKTLDTVPEIHCASTEGFDRRDPKMRLIKVLFLRTISEIKLKRTDTTLDLSQKACNTLLAINITRRLGVQVKLTKRAKEKEKRR
jgi:hypothetical protein